MNYLGIDYGEHRVGIAFADSELRWAFPRVTIDQKKENLFERLTEIQQKEKIDCFVVGMPYHPDGRTNGKNVVVEAFIVDLKNHFPEIPVYTQDESYTSVQALERTSYLSKKKKKNAKGIIDCEAASIILQNFLDNNV